MAAVVVTVSHNALAAPFPELPQGDVYVNSALEVEAGRSSTGSRLMFVQPVFGNNGPPDLGVGAILPLAYELRVSVPASSGARVTFEGEGSECAADQPASICLIVTDQALPAGDTLIPGQFAIRGGPSAGVLVTYSIHSPYPDIAGTDQDNANTVLV